MKEKVKIRNARGDTAEYISDILNQLIALALQAELSELVYALRIAEGEAEIQGRLLKGLNQEDKV